MTIKNSDIFITTTDTVIGIGGKVNEEVKNKIYKLKKRDISKQLIIVVSSIDQLSKLENLNSNHYEYINKYWPGATTLIINKNAYRMPNNKNLLKLIEEQGPFYLTSCNISGKPVVKNMNEAKALFPNLLYFDFGSGSNKPSRIIDVDTKKIIRN